MGLDDTFKNKAEEFAGAAKQKFGEVSGDEQVEAEGRADKLAAKGKEFANKAGEKLEDAKEALANAGEKVQENLQAGLNKAKEIFNKDDEEK